MSLNLQASGKEGELLLRKFLKGSSKGRLAMST